MNWRLPMKKKRVVIISLLLL
ncbi:tRNA (uracil-5-)-methyltransferase, partial [Listeria monocytogenes]|nr:tRNA (uracil-5-)-methyltransferase [Listeria monocytogenes]